MLVKEGTGIFERGYIPSLQQLRGQQAAHSPTADYRLFV